MTYRSRAARAIGVRVTTTHPEYAQAIADIAHILATELPVTYRWLRCGLCERVTIRQRRTYGGLMHLRACGECLPVVRDIDAGGAVQAIEKEFSVAFNSMQRAA